MANWARQTEQPEPAASVVPMLQRHGRDWGALVYGDDAGLGRPVLYVSGIVRPEELPSGYRFVGICRCSNGVVCSTCSSIRQDDAT
jgi:hypothetical protein